MTTQAASPSALRLQKQGARLIMDQPFFGCCFLYMRRVETRAVPTMVVDGVHLFFNPEFVAELDDDALRMVLAHETMHILLRHQLRKGARDHKRWNRATDYAINRELISAGFKMPTGKWAGLLDSKFDGMTAEAVYDLLTDDAGKGAGKGAPGSGQPGAGEPGDGDGDDSEGEGAGEGAHGAGDAPCGFGEVLPTPENGDGSEGSTPERVAGDWEIRARQAAMQAAKAGKHIPGSVQRLLAELGEPVIDWRDVFRRFVGTGISDDSSWNRPNRRLISAGVYLPSHARTRLKRVLVFFDTSGSISAADLGKDAAEAKGMLDDAGCEVMTWACVDTRVRSFGEVSSGDEVPSIDFAGGGGTHFADAMAWAAQLENASEIACAVFFTDGETASWGEEPPFPVLWCGHNTKARWKAIAASIPYGEAVYRGA